MRFVLPLTILVAALFSPDNLQAQAYKDAIGYNALLSEKGSGLEDGSGVRVLQPEAGTNYMPDSGDSEFSGKSFTNGSNTSMTSSSHATDVGKNFYGNSLSIAPGVTDITGYQADDYINRFLGVTTGDDPMAMGFDVGNHSYVERANLPAAETKDILQRFDYVINRDNTVMVVGADNGSGNPTRDLMAPSYNAITVGLSSGNHARGVTFDYGPGRYKPDIVAPAGATSYSTPIVAAAAALLREAGTGTNAIQNEVIKSNLFAGAKKEELSGWDRTTTRPIDDVFGYGELNIYNSYHILEGGEFEGSTSDPTSNVGLLGWDYGQFDGTNDLFYNFVIAGQATELSAALVWNIEVTDTDDTSNFNATTSLANLDLKLYDSTDSFLGSMVDSSLSTIYNTEHIHQLDLAAGNYTFQISGESVTDFGFSWRISTIPEPSSATIIGCLVLLVLSRRRRG